MLGSLLARAETGDGTGRPREQFLYTTSSRLYDAYLVNYSISVFHAGPFRSKVDCRGGGKLRSMTARMIKVFLHLKWPCPIDLHTHAPKVYQASIAADILPLEFPCLLPLI